MKSLQRAPLAVSGRAVAVWMLSIVIVGVTTGCGRPQETETTSADTSVVRVDGSSTVFPITEAVAEEYQKENSGVRITVGISGTGGGFQRFCRGETDISDASRPIKPVEIEACGKQGVEFIELPVAYDGLVVVVNPQNTWVDHLTAGELKTMWAPEAQGKVTRWNQIRTGWPDRELHLFGAGVDSGTYDYFTEAIVGKEGASRGDFTSSEDDNVLVQGVAGDELALGFFGIAYFEQNRARLKAIPIDDGNASNGTQAIAPAVASVKDGTYQPLSRPLFVYVSKAAAERPNVRGFVDYYLTHGDELAGEVGYVPLGDEGYRLARQHFADRITGTAFGKGGSQVGVTIEQLLSRERK
jgi:phosphate transport system substrate-binding protein